MMGMKPTPATAIGVMACWLIVQVGAIAASAMRVRISALAPSDAETWAMAQLLVTQVMLISIAGTLVLRQWIGVVSTAATYPPMWAVAGLLAGVDVERWWIGGAVVMSWHLGVGAIAIHWERSRAWIACLATLLALAGPVLVYLAADARRNLPMSIIEPISPTLAAVRSNPAGLLLPLMLLCVALIRPFMRRPAAR